MSAVEDETSRVVSDGSDESSDDASSESGPDLMITTRERRKTAGNRYSAIVAQEQAGEDEDDDVALLFAEAEGEDEEYNSDEGDDEADMSTSDEDDDDQGPAAGAGNLEGEAELEKEAKAERAKKRKADMAMTSLSGLRKKPRIDPTALHRAPERPKPSKRKDRESWLPVESSAPGRTSLRKQTVARREDMMERLKENEEQRLKNRAVREEKEKIKQAAARPKLTQADRLAEAEKNERRNAKSLNRWEAMEARRAEEQAAKLAALQNRTLIGPVVTFHSSKHMFRYPKVQVLAPGETAAEEPQAKKRGRKPKNFMLPNIANSLVDPSAPDQQARSSMHPTAAPTATMSQASATTSGSLDERQKRNLLPSAPASTNGSDWLSGVHEYASMQSAGTSRVSTPASAVPSADTPAHDEQKPAVQSRNNLSTDQPMETVITDDGKSSTTALQTSQQMTADQPIPPVGAPDNSKTTSTADRMISNAPAIQTTPAETNINNMTASAVDQSVATPTSSGLINATSKLQSTPQSTTILTNGQNLGSAEQVLSDLTAQQHGLGNANTGSLDQAVSTPVSVPEFANSTSEEQLKAESTPPPMDEVIATRNLVILDHFEQLTTSAKEAYSVFFNTRNKALKPTKHVAQLCAMTGLPARYRDPESGVAYANMHAYQKLEALQNHEYSWSSMLGCYIGKTDKVARGVPEGFV